MTAHRSLARRAAAVAAAATAAVVLAACGSTGSTHSSGPAHASAPSSAPASAGAHKSQDTAFAQGMIPHHRQAVAMADLAASRAKSQDVKDLATEIAKAQAPEITTMSGWLKAWGQTVPAGDMPSMAGIDASGHDMSGMMSEEDMQQLAKLSGTAFDTAFLRMMIQHHQGALTMARSELSKGAYGPAKTLAQSIITSQSAQIAQMNRMLGK